LRNLDDPASFMRNQTLQEVGMEFGTIEHEIYIEATPEIVFDVVSSPDHLKQWWPDEAHYEPTPGSVGTITFLADGADRAEGKVVAFTVVDARPPRLFSFRWTHPADEVAAASNSLLVTFDLAPSGGGTLLRMTETGFRDEETYQDHVTGWNYFMPRLAPYVATLQVRP